MQIEIDASCEGTHKSRREFLMMLSSGALALLAASCVPRNLIRQESKEPPNLVIIFTDDQGYADVGCFGAQGFTTPNLDRMAEEGVRFTDFYSAAPMCTPSRAALMTGCYPVRVGLPNVLGPSANVGINSDEITIAELLKARGYSTACFGKWHLGHHKEFLPLQHGFDEYFGLPYSNDMGPAPNPKRKNVPPLPLVEGNETIGIYPDQTQLTTLYTERAVKFIEKNKERPFFLYLPHTMVHIPLHVSEKYLGKSERGLYGDAIEEVDWSVGRILGTLKRTGVDDNTLVIFTSDNGPWLLYGPHGGSALPLREGKGTTFEGGMRMPCIMRWPGRIPAGIVCRKLATTMDVFPTIAHLAGAEAPQDRIIDGRDIWPLMSGKPGARTPHDVFYYYRSRELQALRSGKWKFHRAHGYRHVEGTAPEPGKSARDKEARIEQSLFDLENDISETMDVSRQHPDVVERFLKLAEVAREDLGDGQLVGKGVRPCGKVTAQP